LEYGVDDTVLVYGWDSEDDAYFPTSGSRLSLAAFYSHIGCPSSIRCDRDRTNWSAAYKQTWSTADRSTWTVNVGGEPVATADRMRPLNRIPIQDLQITYSRAFSPESWETIRRARWYVGAGYSPFQLSRDGRIGGQPDQAALTIGVRLESRTFGIIDLNASATRLLD
jgi:hypothetical protein